MILYIGPGIGVATIVIVILILGIVLLSLVIVLFRPFKRLVVKIRNFLHGK